MFVRSANVEDYDKIMSLYSLFLEDNKRFINHNGDSFKEVINSKNNFVYVIEEKSNLAGFISFSKRRVIRYPKAIIELDELYILPEFRKQGLGKKLIEKLEQIAKDMDCCRIFIESRHDQQNAHNFYIDCGFTNLGVFFIKNI